MFMVLSHFHAGEAWRTLLYYPACTALNPKYLILVAYIDYSARPPLPTATINTTGR